MHSSVTAGDCTARFKQSPKSHLTNGPIKTRTEGVVTSRRRAARPISSSLPSKTQFAKNLRRRAALMNRKLGVSSCSTASNGMGSSQALQILGADAFAEFQAATVAGKVIWCNFDLARQLGFSVPTQNQLTKDLQDQLLELSLRATGFGEGDGNQTITMYADKYGGDGLGPALGAGRAGFLPYGNLYVKGVGFTPLFRHNDKDDFAHSHGGVHLDDCLVEAVFGEVNENLFVNGSSRILAVIDQGKHVTDPEGRRISIGIAVRVGAQLRPAHLLTRLRRKQGQLDKFVDITRASGQLVTRGDSTPDIQATMLRIIDDHARTSAEAFRWRMIHGAISASNMDISGAMLDLPTQSTQPRTAPIQLLAYADSAFGSEHTSRALHLAPVYRKLLRNVPESEWSALNIVPLNLRTEMADTYARHLQIQMLCAAGLKTELARRIQQEHSKLSKEFSDVLVNMAAVRNRGQVSVAREIVENVSALDVFNLLRKFPPVFFGNPAADHRAEILDLLEPILRGGRLHKRKQYELAEAAAERFLRSYRELMRVGAAYTREYYGDIDNLRVSITSRAAFENEPMDRLYSYKLFTGLRRAIRGNKSAGDANLISEAVDHCIAASLRSVEGLLHQGNAQLIEDDGVQLEMRTINGVGYAVRAWDDKHQTRRLHIGVQLQRQGDLYATSLPEFPLLTRSQLLALRVSYSLDDGKTFDLVEGRLKQFDKGQISLGFDIDCNIYQVARLEGSLFSSLNQTSGGPQSHTLKGYVFMIPDRRELLGFVNSPWR